MSAAIMIFVASLLGSPHCAAMCGGFAAMSCNSDRPRAGQLLYNLGRMASYVVLGAAAGFIGSNLNFGISRFGIHQAASLFAGILLIVWGVAALFNSKLPQAPRKVTSKIAAFANKFSRNRSGQLIPPFLLGASSAFLPCGWLYTYVAVAGGTGSTAFGAITMFIFWLGTLPILITIGGLSRMITSPVKKFAPTLTSLLIIMAGLFSLYDHISATYCEHSHHTQTVSHTEHHH